MCTPEGKTWLARITGVGGPGGFHREFYDPVGRDLTRSGKTGVLTYELDDGVYESNEGRRRLGRRYHIVVGGELREGITRAEAIEAGEGIDWGIAEALAFGTLLLEAPALFEVARRSHIVVVGARRSGAVSETS